MTTETAAKKDIQKLQRAIVDGLEDVKAQDIQVFNTEHLSSLFERVMIASGTSNRQTKALAASVRDAVRDAGFAKPRMEGEENGEWIIVDCGQAVVHIMQPNIRQYYHLEDLWGDKPVRLKFGSDKPTAKTPAKTTAEAKPATLKRSSAAKKGVSEVFPSKAQEKKAAAKKAAAKTTVKTPARKTGVSKSAGVAKVVAKAPAKKSPPTSGAKVPAKKTVARKA
ncbi:MAG: ribosome silencing factor [Hylemonella sp.]|nr:ribosome silencing factor [Hylemonella sp.]MDP1937998.1 ribosome silencing factor [Hylemonella sp.]